jgi:MFS family permease
MFSLANGLCEAVINPLVATLFPKQKTHYLNILHAGWPGGIVLGGLLGYSVIGEGAFFRVRWEAPMTFFLVPTFLYGAIALREKFPISEARAAGVGFKQMLSEFAAPLLLLLLFLHALVGYVELGTDSWITNIMQNVIPSALLLLVYTSGIMFVLRFFAGPIVERINPLGLLFVSASLGCAGLVLLGSATSAIAIFLAATVYGFGKTFLWPTMLGVVGERFPRGGALTMGTMGGVGTLCAGLLATPGIGYTQDFFASKNLKETSPTAFARVVSTDENSFLMLPAISGLDGNKVAKIGPDDPEFNVVKEAGIFGGRMALKCTAVVPATMAIGYLLLVLYFRAIGGYKQVELDRSGHPHETSFEPKAADAIGLGLEGPGQA